MANCQCQCDYHTGISFVKVRDVKTPARGTPQSAGIDFFVPEYNEQFLEDLKKTNLEWFEWTQDRRDDFRNVEFNENYLIVHPSGRIRISSGIHVKIPKNYMLTAFNKSGVATKHGLDVLACVVDSDYQGEINLSLTNTSPYPVVIDYGQKLVQFILMPVLLVEPKELKDLESLHPVQTERGAGGFGSTGV